MRAITSDGQALRLVRDHPEPSPVAGEAVIAPSRVLLTPADFGVIRRVLSGAGGCGGERAFSGVIGHQFVGVVRKVGGSEGAGGAGAGGRRSGQHPLVGRRVVASSAIPCGNCDLCRRALSAHCRYRRVAGIAERDGCLSDLVAMPVSALHIVPEGVSDDAAVLAGWMASAAHTANLLRSHEHVYTTVMGDSPLALLTARVLTRKNASVRLLSDRPETAELCERWGIKQRRPSEPGRRQDQDVVVDCTVGEGGEHGDSAGAWGLELALQMVRPRGLIVLKSPAVEARGEGASAGRIDLTPAIVNEVQIVGSREGPIPDGLALLKEFGPDVVSVLGVRGQGASRVGMSEAVAAAVGAVKRWGERSAIATGKSAGEPGQCLMIDMAA